MKRRVFYFLFSLVLFMIFSGCNDVKKVSVTENKELVYAMADDVNDMNPHLYIGSMSAQGIVFESLIKNTEDGFKPLLAKSWEISDDGKSYTFHLRKGVKFHDGEPFDAKAVKENIDAVQRNAKVHTGTKLSTKIKSVEILDNYTVVLHLFEAYYPTLHELSLVRPYAFISPKNFINKETKDGINGYSGTGAYKLAEHKVDQFTVFEANEDYWGAKPKIAKITAKVLPSGETTFMAMKKGEVNFIFTGALDMESIDADAMSRLSKTGDYAVYSSEPAYTKVIIANSGRVDSPVHEKAVRLAIWHGIDRQTISNEIYSKTEPPADTFFSTNVVYADIALKKRAFDLIVARKILEQAGWKLNDEQIRYKNGKRLSMTLYYDTSSPHQKLEAEFIQNSLQKIGIELKLIGEMSGSLFNRWSKGEYELLFKETWGHAYDPQSTVSNFSSGLFYFHAIKGIEKADELYNKANIVMSEMDEKKRRALYEDILKIVYEEALFIPITYGNVTIVAPSNLQGIALKQALYEIEFENMYFK
jgi:nickel transport system substrate-binding protein